MRITINVLFARSIVLLCLFMSHASDLSAQDILIDNYSKALNIIDSASKRFEGTGKSTNHISFEVRGSFFMAGHFFSPEETKEVEIKEIYQFLSDRNTIAYKSEAKLQGNDYMKTQFIFDDTLLQIDYGEKELVRLNKSEANKTTSDYHLLFPYMGIEMALVQRSSIQYIDEDHENYILSFNDYIGRRISAWINKKDFTVAAFRYLSYSELLGDQLVEYLFDDYQSKTSVIFPAKIRVLTRGLIQYELECFQPTNFVNILPEVIEMNPQYSLDHRLQVEDEIEINKIGENIYLFKLHYLDNKILIAEYSDYIAVFEAPLGGHKGIKKAIKKKFGNKKIKYLFISHHHPDHVGDIQPYALDDAIIITTKGYEKYYSKLINSNRRLVGINVSHIKPQFDFVEDPKKIYNIENNDFVVFRVENNSHSFEHLMVWFPNDKILFVSDLVFFGAEGNGRGGARAKSVLQVVSDNHLSVDKIYTSWPLRGQREFGSLNDLKEISQ